MQWNTQKLSLINKTKIMTDSFPTLISRFGKLVENNPPVKSIQKELDDIKEAAKNNSSLTSRQVSAVIDRVNNYLVGKYSKNKT